ncbi:hypothetical protein CTDIVETGP_0296 [Clostridium tyrobutyricum DIVETGP]|uniref:Uncharacterized protein n=1 Tax=Clostridium tyrobutyricum DIVETGP TaxID=1408889 RepID=W6N2H2_CLOTY|nr:hypothetical protein CTK_C00940 [Clostridium tyrobutyricum]CDL90226.1 hypothetical protein CTDIVETGP_0296 [Clostridium tyrobutyricum DIVETGP]
MNIESFEQEEYLNRVTERERSIGENSQEDLKKITWELKN